MSCFVCPETGKLQSSARVIRICSHRPLCTRTSEEHTVARQKRILGRRGRGDKAVQLIVFFLIGCWDGKTWNPVLNTEDQNNINVPHSP